MNFSLRVTSGPGVGKSFSLDSSGSMKFGRLDTNHFVLTDDSGISRQHFEILFENGKYWIRDLNSRNGTYLNRRAVLTSELNSGDEIRAGNTTMVVVPAEADPTSDAIMPSGLEKKSKVEFLYREDDTTVSNINIRISSLDRQSLFDNSFFKSAYLDLPGKAILLNEPDIRNSIDSNLDFEEVGDRALLIFPQSMDTLESLRDQHFGNDSMILMNYSCRRQRLVKMIDDSIEKFGHPKTLVQHFKALPLEAAAGLMNGIDLAVCESEESNQLDVIHDASHSGRLRAFAI